MSLNAAEQPMHNLRSSNGQHQPQQAYAAYALEEIQHDPDDDEDDSDDEYYESSDDEDNQEVDNDEDNDVADPEPLRATLLSPMSKTDPRRMTLWEEERDWALAIKEAIEQNPDVDNLSDYKYAQLALMVRYDVEGAVTRAHQLQAYREDYKILDTVTDGMRCLHGSMQLFPRQLLNITFSERESSYILIHNASGFTRRTLNTLDKLRAWLGACYYILTCLCPDFESIRRGAIFISECDGFDWTKNMHLDTYRKYWSELGVAYPIRYQKIKQFHNGMLFNLMFSMLKPLLPEHIRNTFELGCQFDGKLDEMYLTPTVELANQRVLLQLEDLLRRRYHHETVFRL